MKTIPALLVCAHLALAQDAVHTIPFASKGNVIDLLVANTSAVTVEKVTVKSTSVPEWLKLDVKEIGLSQLKSNEEKTASFVFSIEKTAPVKGEHTIAFTIVLANGEQWMKEIRVRVSAPEDFELFQNFPNPFNPSTTISYQLTADSRITIKIFNLLGQEVVDLVDGERVAGFHQEVWDASRFSSGMYVCQLIANDASNNRQIARKTMILLK